MMANRLTRSALFMLAAILLQVAPARAQVYTIAPSPFQTALDDSGNIIVNGCVWTYAAGTSSAINTYSNNAGALNSNPIIADYAGRFTVYLLAGTNYKFVYESACAPPAHGTTMRSQDNVAGVPAAAATVDVTGTAGEAISAGQCAYLSDGSGAKAAGQWFKCDAANAYSNTSPEVGMTISAIASASSGTIRLQGLVSGLSSLSIGQEYFIGTAGAITSTAPVTSRHLGHADTAGSLVLTADPPPPQMLDNGINDFRLTLTTAVPVTSADVTGASAVTIFCAPYRGNRLALYSASGSASVFTSAEFSIAVPATTSTMYDVFAYNNAGVPALELLAWTNVTTRATAVVLTTTGAWTKSGDLTRRYLGSVMTGTVSGQTEDSATKRYLWNYYNRVPRPLLKASADATWNYTTATVRQANASTANQVDVVVGIAEVPIELLVTAFVNNANNVAVQIGIGEDSTSTISASTIGGGGVTSTGSVFPGQNLSARFVKYPAVGRHVYSWNEWSAVGGVSAWYGTPSAQGGLAGTANGISGSIQG